MYYEQYDAVTWITAPCYIFVILIGSFGNVIILRAYFTDPTIQTNSYHLLLANGAFADLVMCCVFTPILLIYRINEHAHMIEYSPLCELSIFTSTLSISIQYVVFPLLSINRFDTSSRPLTPWLSKRLCKTILMGAWGTCAGVSLSLVVILYIPKGHDGSPKLHKCILASQSLDLFSGAFMLYSFLLYCASILVTVRSYFQMYRAIADERSLHHAVEEDDIGRTKINIIVAVVYTAFWTPFVLVQFCGIFGHYSEVIFNLHALSSVFGVMASTVIPYLYFSKDRYYKRIFTELVKCSRWSQSNSEQ